MRNQQHLAQGSNKVVNIRFSTISFHSRRFPRRPVQKILTFGFHYLTKTSAMPCRNILMLLLVCPFRIWQNQGLRLCVMGILLFQISNAQVPEFRQSTSAKKTPSSKKLIEKGIETYELDFTSTKNEEVYRKAFEQYNRWDELRYAEESRLIPFGDQEGTVRLKSWKELGLGEGAKSGSLSALRIRFVLNANGQFKEEVLDPDIQKN